MDQEPTSGKLIPHIANFGLAVIASNSGVSGMKQDLSIGLSHGYAGTINQLPKPLKFMTVFIAEQTHQPTLKRT